MRPESTYIVTKRHLEQFEELCSALQSLFLDIYSNYEVPMPDDGHEGDQVEH